MWHKNFYLIILFLCFKQLNFNCHLANKTHVTQHIEQNKIKSFSIMYSFNIFKIRMREMIVFFFLEKERNKERILII